MIQLKTGGDRLLQKIATRHYDKVKKEIEEKITDDLNNLNKEKINNGLLFLGDFLKNNLERIISGEPQELKKIIDTLKDIQLEKKIKEIQTKKKKQKELTIKEVLESIFFYSSYDKWEPYQLARNLGVDTCPYCNRQYISVVGSDKEKGTRCEFDHFYDKATYPYLALSFYNLIPSCHVCNSNFKGTTKFTLEKNIHPYMDGFQDDVKFTYIPTEYDGLIGSENFEIDFAFYSKDDNKIKRIQRNIYDFDLDGQYEHHKSTISEIIRKKVITNSTYLDTLLKLYPDAFQSKEELYQLAFGNYPDEKDFHKRPLSKLTRDIAEELGLI